MKFTDLNYYPSLGKSQIWGRILYLEDARINTFLLVQPYQYFICDITAKPNTVLETKHLAQHVAFTYLDFTDLFYIQHSGQAHRRLPEKYLTT